MPPWPQSPPGAAGEWSVKDLIVHLTSNERWMADRMGEALRGETYTPTAPDTMHWDERNNVIYQRNRDRPLPDVLADSREAFRRLIEVTEAHSEGFLLEP